LTDDAELHFAKAKDLLRQALLLDPGETPEPLIHISYYAMFHAALAVLSARMQTPPTKHRGVILHFNRVSKDMGDDARAAAKALQVAFDRRLLADYGVLEAKLSHDAVETRDAARNFLDYCGRILGETKPGTA
jgi:uncharacterized protein (UPF0332 family)